MCSLDMKTRTLKKRRTRKDFTTEEINYLCSGVKKMGNHWNLILWSYPFQKGRTNVDLAKKYYRLQLQVILILFSTNHICGQLGFQLLPLNGLAKKSQTIRICNPWDCTLCQFNAMHAEHQNGPRGNSGGLVLGGRTKLGKYQRTFESDSVQREQGFQLRTLN